MCKNIVRNVIEYAQIHQILTDNKYSAPTFFRQYTLSIYFIFLRAQCSITQKQRKSIFRLYINGCCATTAAHLMQQLFDSACHVYYQCISTYKPCLGNNMCEFSCCNCSPFLFFSVSTKTSFFISPSFSDHTQKHYLFQQLIISASKVLGTLAMLLEILT